MSAEAYSPLDRLLHHVAFAGLGMQRALADIEDRIFGGEFSALEIEKPVFVTSLPRAGTTLFLEILARCPEFATHSYRDMPFVLCPILWDRLSRGWRQSTSLKERAHGDGVLVGYDSPEAFEEVVWKAFWPRKYATDRILPFTCDDRDAEFEEFLRAHMRKLIGRHAAAQSAGGSGVRYLSKNNALIGRLDLLRTLFPDAHVVIPLRDPWAHVTSLKRQHARFLKLHAEDRFSRRYMEWLGHYEFGATLRPIDFDGWLSENEDLDPMEDDFWLRYWMKAYEVVLKAQWDRLHIVDYELACADPIRVLGTLADVLELENPTALTVQADRFRSPTPHDGRGGRSSPLGRRVSEIYEALRKRAL